MRIRGISLLFCLLHVLVANESYMRELFGTNDVALFTQYKCARMIEVELASDKCPLGLSDSENLDDLSLRCDSHTAPETVRIHLVRDEEQKHSPRILFLYTSKKMQTIGFGVEEISFADNQTQWRVPNALVVNAYTPGPQISSNEVWSDSVYDTRSSLLYIFIRDTRELKLRHVYVFFVSNIFNTKKNEGIQFKLIMKESVEGKMRECSNFVENPYDHTVSYLCPKSSGSVTLNRISIAQLIPNLFDGRGGTALRDIPDPLRQLVLVHNDSLISHQRIEERQSYNLRKGFVDGTGRRCVVPTGIYPTTTRRIIAIMGWDYCKLKYGGDGTKDAEGGKCPVYTEELVAADNSSSSNYSIFIVIVVLLGMVCLLLFVYVCWLRRNLEDSLPNGEHKPVPYYPSGQPLDSTFDMSVDRWDQY